MIQLNAPLISGGNVLPDSFLITPDGNNVIYIADQEVDEKFEVYSVPILGGTPIKLNPPLFTEGDVINVQITPDGTTVVFEANTESEDIFELYATSIINGNPIRLNSDIVPNANRGVAFRYKLTPNGGHVIYTAEQNNGGRFDLFNVPITGGTPIQLRPNLASNEFVNDLNIAIPTDESFIIYGATNSLGNEELFRVPFTGGESTTIINDFPTFGFVLPFIMITPDNSTVIYAAFQLDSNAADLFAISTNGGEAIRLNNPLPTGVSFSSISLRDDVKVSPDSNKVIFNLEQNTDNVDELFSVSITGGDVTRLNSDLPENGDVSSNLGFKISSDSNFVVYLAEQNINDLRELFYVPINGGDSVRVNADLAQEGDVFAFEISTDNTTIVYRSDQDTNDVFELYSVSIDELLSINNSSIVSNTINLYPNPAKESITISNSEKK